jgi:hypothetical protein
MHIDPTHFIPQGKKPLPLDMKLSGPESGLGIGEAINVLPLSRINPRSFSRPVRNLITIRTELSRFLLRNWTTVKFKILEFNTE